MILDNHCAKPYTEDDFFYVHQCKEPSGFEVCTKRIECKDDLVLDGLFLALFSIWMNSEYVHGFQTYYMLHVT